MKSLDCSVAICIWSTSADNYFGLYFSVVLFIRFRHHLYFSSSNKIDFLITVIIALKELCIPSTDRPRITACTYMDNMIFVFDDKVCIFISFLNKKK